MGRQCITSVCASFSTYYCLKMCDFTSMIFTVPLWGSEVANSKTEIHLTNTAVEVGMQSSYICDVTTIEGEGDFTSSGICYCVYISTRSTGTLYLV